MHRDLKPANIFKGRENYKLGDLNVSKVVSGNLAYTQTGTPYYASPEVWRDEPYDAKSDIWSLGCIIYQMAALRPPFQAKDMEELFKNVQNKPTPSIPKQYSKILCDLIQLCLNKKANFRPTASELLEHP
jgi:NIMA (never in mitosis gene a)-related kinase